MKRTKHIAVVASLGFLSVTVLCSCAETATETSASSSENFSVPEFSGEWAGEFSSAYRKSTSDFERKALLDEKISDAEFAEMETRFQRCLADQQITFSGFKTDGAFDFRFADGFDPDKANAITDSCSASTGVNTIGSLYFAMKRNPQNLNEATIMAACLVKKNAVPQGYSADDYNRDAPEFSFPFSEKNNGQKSYDECSDDPLGLLSQGS